MRFIFTGMKIGIAAGIAIAAGLFTITAVSSFCKAVMKVAREERADESKIIDADDKSDGAGTE